MKEWSALPEPGCCGAVHCIDGAESLRKDGAARLGEAALSWTLSEYFLSWFRIKPQESWRNLTRAETLYLCSRKPMKNLLRRPHFLLLRQRTVESCAMWLRVDTAKSNAAVQDFPFKVYLETLRQSLLWKMNDKKHHWSSVTHSELLHLILWWLRLRVEGVEVVGFVYRCITAPFDARRCPLIISKSGSQKVQFVIFGDVLSRRSSNTK